MNTQPVQVIQAVNRLMRTSRDMMLEIGHEPGPEQLAEKLGIPIEKVHRLLEIARTPIRLNGEPR